MAKGDLAKAHPTKAFFVKMLTRDISLADAILDLVDNSLDGALRVSDGDVDYKKFHADVSLSSERFELRDNCGGIPRRIAIEHAFKMGREPDDKRDDDLETIGMYGIGMKRAMFKMGADSKVVSRHKSDTFQVAFDSAWLGSKTWRDIPLTAPTEDLSKPGTVVVVEDLYPGISERFAADDFVDELKKALGDHFATFLEQGFTITVNGTKVRPTMVRLLLDKSVAGPKPFYFETSVGDTQIRIVVGINSPASLDKDDDDEEADLFADNRAIATAGWTILCNERAVVVGDKTRSTGWGDGVPMYHPQFSVITGIVEFSASHARSLPITTTKRALDTSAESWLLARSVMRDGLAIFTSHTNRWKNISREKQAPAWADAEPVTLDQISKQMHRTKSLKKHRRVPGAMYFDPVETLPRPESNAPTHKWIRFSRPISRIKKLASELIDDPDARPGHVGEVCFDRVYDELFK